MTAHPANIQLDKHGAEPATTAPLTAAELAAAIGGDETLAERVLGPAVERVFAYAPDAPAAVQREAIVRFAGYLAQSDFGGIAKESIGPREVEYVANHAAMFRNSGAAGLLARWRVRRAGAVG